MNHGGTGPAPSVLAAAACGRCRAARLPRPPRCLGLGTPAELRGGVDGAAGLGRGGAGLVGQPLTGVGDPTTSTRGESGEGGVARFAPHSSTDMIVGSRVAIHLVISSTTI